MLEAPSLARVSFPGQFCLLTVPGVFLRRPLSIFQAAAARVEFLYRVVGKGTEELSKRAPGGMVRVLGPLGTGYPVGAARAKTPLLVAGGTGVASLNFLAQKLSGGILFYGAKTKSEIVCTEGFKKPGWKVMTATEDGSSGCKGFVTELLDRHLSGSPAGKTIVYTCGPHAMMKKVAEICAVHSVPGYASLEEKMACGVGNCQGCPVEISGEHKLVCKDGPVFNMQAIDWR